MYFTELLLASLCSLVGGESASRPFRALPSAGDAWPRGIFSSIGSISLTAICINRAFEGGGGGGGGGGVLTMIKMIITH